MGSVLKTAGIAAATMLVMEILFRSASGKINLVAFDLPSGFLANKI